jgi:hypothetical protein
MDPALDRGPQPAADPEPIAALPPSAGTSIIAALARSGANIAGT